MHYRPHSYTEQRGKEKKQRGQPKGACHGNAFYYVMNLGCEFLVFDECWSPHFMQWHTAFVGVRNHIPSPAPPICRRLRMQLIDMKSHKLKAQFGWGEGGTLNGLYVLLPIMPSTNVVRPLYNIQMTDTMMAQTVSIRRWNCKDEGARTCNFRNPMFGSCECSAYSDRLSIALNGDRLDAAKMNFDTMSSETSECQ